MTTLQRQVESILNQYEGRGEGFSVLPRAIIDPGDTIGNVDPDVYRAVSITVSWDARNDGGAAGQVAGHLIIQERGPTGENYVVELDINPTIQQPRVRHANLTVPPLDIGHVEEVPLGRRNIAFDLPKVSIAPGATGWVVATLEVGTDLLEGKSGLDVVVIMDRLPEVSGIGEVRFPDAFDVITILAFEPVPVGAPTMSIAAVP